jgi:DNA-binding transcriptional ArsR family regulator
VRSGRPPIDFLDIRILALLDERLFHSADSIAEALGVSHSTILSHLPESLCMENFYLGWILHKVTTSLRKIRMETCRE